MVKQKNKNHLNQLQGYEVKSEHLTLMHRESLKNTRNKLAQVQTDWDRPTPKKNIKFRSLFLKKCSLRIMASQKWWKLEIQKTMLKTHIQTPPQIGRVQADS